jgi:hypothetical protein
MKHRALLLFFSKKRQLVSPSLLGFLSPGNGGTEEGVKTIEGWERLFFSKKGEKFL